MLLCNVKTGFLYYGETRHREKIEITDELRATLKQTVTEMHMLYKRKHTPKVKPTKSCKACSLAELCLPKLYKAITVREYIENNTQEAGQ
ncbi:MAG: hypothetical protein BGN88_09105 [Clostridiales bacterium 43-6]|nr:MAG: hypothetical protein BGN88_09105 [Clostridiales bacterium 43-6]